MNYIEIRERLESLGWIRYRRNESKVVYLHPNYPKIIYYYEFPEENVPAGLLYRILKTAAESEQK